MENKKELEMTSHKRGKCTRDICNVKIYTRRRPHFVDPHPYMSEKENKNHRNYLKDSCAIVHL